MPAPNTLYQEVFQVISTVASSSVPSTSVARLATLVSGIIAAKSCVVAQVARELASLRLSRALAESVERRLRRTLNDYRLKPEVLYQPLLRQLIDWQQIATRPFLVLAIDESSKEEEIHLFRMSLTYHGRAIPLAWAVWEQNIKMAPGIYWQTVDAVLAKAALVLPQGARVVVVADRAYDIPPFIDRIAAYGWHWVVRGKAKGSTRFLDYQGREHTLSRIVGQRVSRPGMRWKARGKLFKKVGWREASIVGLWAQGEKGPLVVLTDLPPRWEVLALFDRRFWIEPAFRDDKSRGWQWEDSQVKGGVHHDRLLLGMAIASLVTLCLGLQEAKERLERLRARPMKQGASIGKPRRAKESLFTMGLARARAWLYGNIQQGEQWLLTELEATTWLRIWYAHQSYRYIFHCPVRP